MITHLKNNFLYSGLVLFFIQFLRSIHSLPMNTYNTIIITSYYITTLSVIHQYSDNQLKIISILYYIYIGDINFEFNYNTYCWYTIWIDCLQLGHKLVLCVIRHSYIYNLFSKLQFTRLFCFIKIMFWHISF